MLKGYRTSLVCTTSALALAVAAAAPAHAQGQTAQAAVGLEEIIVTARRVEENILRVPIAITAFSPEKLAMQDIKDAWTLTKSVGGFHICCSPGNASFVYIRGINNGTPTYFAEIPQANAGGFSGFFDVANIQVLKGPQGTLFGQASNAGALIYQPRKPGETFGGNVSISGGNYGRRTIEGGVDVPLIEDKVLLRLAGQSYYREGFVEDIRTNKQFGDQNYYVLRPSVIIRPTENIENYTMFQFTKQKGFPLPFVLNDINMNDKLGFSLTGGPLAADTRNTQRLGNIGTIGATPAGVTLWNDLRDQVLARQIQLGPYKIDGHSSGCASPLGPIYGHGLVPPYTGPISNLNYNRVSCSYTWSRNIFLTNHTTWDITDNLILKNIFGYSQTNSFNQPSDTDGTPLILFDSGSPKNNTPTHGGPTWSDEIQLQGTKIGGMLDFTIGTFHTAEYNNPLVTHSAALGVSHTASITKTSSRSRAVYGQGNLDLGALSEGLEGVTFTAGYRYTWDTVKRQQWNLNATTLAIVGAVQGGPGTPSGEGRFKAGSYTFGLQYQYTPDIMFFLTNAKGYSAGGLQNAPGFEKFSPDSLNNIEGGVKGTFNLGDWTIRTTTSYFYGDFKNVKVSVTQLVQNTPPPAPKNLQVVTQNAAKGRIHGLDTDITIVPNDWLEVGGYLAYTDTKYTKWDNLNPLGQPYNAAGSPFSGTAKIKYAIRATVHAPWVDQAEWGDISISGNLTWTDNMYSAPGKPFDTPSVAGNPNTVVTKKRCRTAANGYGPLSADGKCVDLNEVSSFYNLDINIDWRDMMGQDGLNGSIFITNVTKNTVGYGGCYCDVALGLNAPAPVTPRMFGVRVGYSF